MKRDSVWKIIGIGLVQNMLHLGVVFAVAPLLGVIPPGPWSVSDYVLLFAIFSATYSSAICLFRRYLYDKRTAPKKFALMYGVFGLFGLAFTYNGIGSAIAILGQPFLAYVLAQLILGKSDFPKRG